MGRKNLLLRIELWTRNKKPLQSIFLSFFLQCMTDSHSIPVNLNRAHIILLNEGLIKWTPEPNLSMKSSCQEELKLFEFRVIPPHIPF